MNDQPVLSTADDHARPTRDASSAPSLPQAIAPCSPVIHRSPLLNPYLHLVLTITLVTAAEVLLKQGAMNTAPPRMDWLGLASLPSPRVWVGAALLALSGGTWIVVLRALPLYLAFTLSSAVHVTIPICSWLVLGERINVIRWAGISLVLIGIWIIARPASRVEDRP